MPVWIVTGKLGGGKTLWAVRTAFAYLVRDRRVATNVDLFPDAILSPLRGPESCRLVRLPNQCSPEDLDRLWMANASNDEGKNGLVFIDEAATFLNARNFQEKGRDRVIDWIIHSRKMGWDLLIVIQAISGLDKQIREFAAEYKVTVRRLDRMAIPVFSWFGFRVTLPRIHFASVRYGLQPNAPLDHRDFFRGADFFKAYRTKQSIRARGAEEELSHYWPDVVEEAGEAQAAEITNAVADPNPGLYTVLPPWHTKGRYMDRMKLLLVAGRRAFLSGLLAGAALLYAGQQAYQKASGAHKAPVAVAATVQWLDSGSVIVGDDGLLTVIDSKGKVYASRNYEMAGSTVRMLVDGRWIGLRRHG